METSQPIPTRAEQAGLRLEDVPRPSLARIARQRRLDAKVPPGARAGPPRTAQASPLNRQASLKKLPFRERWTDTRRSGLLDSRPTRRVGFASAVRRIVQGTDRDGVAHRRRAGT